MVSRYPFADASLDLRTQVWWKGSPIPGYDPEVWMRDVCGHVIKFVHHGVLESEYGWEIDHIYPREHGGADTLVNLQPLFWRSNREKGDTIGWTCP